MKPLSFGDIWPQFDWVLEEMRSGMAFFEGYVTSIDHVQLLPGINELIGLASFHGFDSTVWANGTDSSVMKKDYTPDEYVRFFHEEIIVCLSFYYERKVPALELEQKLNFDLGPPSTTMDMICFRDQFLESADPKAAVEAAIGEFRFLKQLFKGDALFIGPDTLDYPTSADNYSNAWLRIE
jgi:hypothetical protein